MSAHEPLVWGPAAEGERTSNGGVIDVPGWVWTCTCGQTGVGYPTESEAEQWCEAHMPEGLTLKPTPPETQSPEGVRVSHSHLNHRREPDPFCPRCDRTHPATRCTQGHFTKGGA